MRLVPALALPLLLALLLTSLSACNEPAAPRGELTALDAAARAVAAPEIFYGPERFVRDDGKPVTATREISTVLYEAPFVIHVRNGDANGDNRVTSGNVTLDGRALLGPSDFNTHGTAEWAIAVSPAENAVLQVSLASKPGSFIDVWLAGVRKPTLFCPDGRPGSIPDLSDAVAATPVDGTILVCDGLHNVDEEVIDKPLTLRAQHSGQATIGDSDPNPTFDNGRPAIWIKGINSGLVRIVDLKFEIKGRGIQAADAWDKIEIDNVTFRGRDPMSAVPVSTRSSTVPGARMEVTNSLFSNMYIGVWPVAAVEVNVRHSVFEDFQQGSVTHSNNTLPGSYAFGRVEDNLIRGCGPSGCIRFFGSNGVIARNRIEVPDGVSREVGILARRIGSHPLPRDPMIIEDNIIIGASRTPTPTDFSNWTLRLGIWVVDPQGTTNIVRRNRVMNTLAAALFTADVDARDNTFTSGSFAFNRLNTTHSVTIQRNDITGFAFVHNSAPGAAGNYQCNWWGSIYGPLGAPNNPAAKLSPWATQPIAGTDVACDPNGPPTVIDSPTALRVCSPWSPADPAAAPTLDIALKAVAPGGTLTLCDGTHVAQRVQLPNKSVTLQAEHRRAATLDAGTADYSLTIGFTTSTTAAFTIDGLNFVNGGSGNVLIAQNYGQVRITSSEFHPRTSLPTDPPRLRAGILVGSAQGNGITVEGNTFVGGDAGVSASMTGLQILNNTFVAQSQSAINLGGNTGGPYLIEGNDFSECGSAWCIVSSLAPNVTIRRNTITVDMEHRTANPIWLQTAVTGEISDNTIIGVGGTRSVDALSWPISQAGISVRGSGSVKGNRVSGAFLGLQLGDNFSFIGTVTDNVVSDVRSSLAVNNFTFAKLDIHRNDFSSFVTAFAVFNAPNGVTSATCNWWGSAGGPVVPESIPANIYSPWASEPIAGNPDVICGP